MEGVVRTLIIHEDIAIDLPEDEEFEALQGVIEKGRYTLEATNTFFACVRKPTGEVVTTFVELDVLYKHKDLILIEEKGDED